MELISIILFLVGRSMLQRLMSQANQGLPWWCTWWIFHYIEKDWISLGQALLDIRHQWRLRCILFSLYQQWRGQMNQGHRNCTRRIRNWWWWQSWSCWWRCKCRRSQGQLPSRRNRRLIDAKLMTGISGHFFILLVLYRQIFLGIYEEPYIKGM